MKLILFSPEERMNSGFVCKVIIDHTDVAAMTSGTATPIFPVPGAATTFPIGTRVKDALVRVTEAFGSTADTITLVATIGDDGDAARYLASVTLKTAQFLERVIAKSPYTYLAANTIDITPTAGVEAITLVNKGEMEVYLNVYNANDLNRPQ